MRLVAENVHNNNGCICWQSLISCLDLIGTAGESWDLFSLNIWDMKVCLICPLPLCFSPQMPKKQGFILPPASNPENTGKGCELQRDFWQSEVKEKWGFTRFREVPVWLLNIKNPQLTWASPDLWTLTAVWGGNRTPTWEAKANSKTSTTPARGFMSVWNAPECDGFKLPPNKLWQ